jgi:hypothetical protein
MQARNESVAVGNDEAQRGQAELTTRERRPRFKLIKLEERIAPYGGIGNASNNCGPTGLPPTAQTVCVCGLN